MTPATRGDWWMSAKGAVYCVVGTGYYPDGNGACVDVLWVTGHRPPQVHRVKLRPHAWRSITRWGTRLACAPGDEARAAAVARVNEILADRGGEDA